MRDVMGRASPFSCLALGAPETPLDLVAYDDRFVVAVDVPGFDRDDLEVRLSGRNLSIDGERGDAGDERDGSGGPDGRDDEYLRRERRTRSFSRRIALPEPVDDESVDARLEGGVLTVVLRKRDGGKRRHRIEID